MRDRENALLNEIARASASSLDLADIADGALATLKDITPFDRAFIALLGDGDTLEIVYASDDRARASPRRRRPAAHAAAARARASRSRRPAVPAGRRARGFRPPRAGRARLRRPRRPHQRRRVHRRPGARRRRRGRLLDGRPSPSRARRHAPRPRRPQRRTLRRHQAPAPLQPQGAQQRPQRQGLLHARPRGTRRRLHGAARQGARLGAGAARPGRGGRLPARHRQDRGLRPRPAQAGRPERARVGADAPASRVQRRHHPPALSARARRRRAPPPRALRRLRLPGGARRRRPSH